MKLYYYIEGHTDLTISDSDEGGYFTELGEVDDDTARRWLDSQSNWGDAVGEICKKIRD